MIGQGRPFRTLVSSPFLTFIFFSYAACSSEAQATEAFDLDKEVACVMKPAFTPFERVLSSPFSYHKEEIQG